MRHLKIIGFVLMIFLGIILFIYGGYDDSPGGQLLGLVLFVGGIVGLIKKRPVV